jgi:hypothetical protein
MADQDQITKLNAQIQELNSQLSGKPIKIFDVNELNEAERVVKSLRQELQEATSDISGLAAGFKNVVQEMQNTSKPLADAKRSFNALSGLAQKLQNDQVGINKLSKNELISIQDKIKAERENQKTLYTNLKQKYEANSITDRELAALVEIEGTLANENVLYNDLLATSKKRLAEEIKIKDAMGLGGAMVGSLKSALDKLGMGGLVDQLGIKAAEEAMENVAGEVTKGGTETAKFGGKVEILKAGMGSLGESMVKNLTDPLFLTKFLTEQLIKAVISIDKVTGDLAKSMNVTYQEATQIQSKLTQIANTNFSVALTSKKIAETQLFINKLYGTTSMATEEQLVNMTKLRELSGFTNEELAGILAISTSTGKEMEQVTGEVIAQAKFTSLKYGVSLNEREVAKDISKISAATTLSLGKNPKSLAEAVATAKSLGMELSKVESIALSMLQFESSIENELSAELLIGKELNLERARFAAINNDVATLASEIASQMGSAANFGEMSAIQQEALAKAVGMNREELAQTLYIQEQLAGLTGEDAKKKEQILNKRIAEVGLAQAQQEIAKDGYDTLENQASVQEQILLATEKLSELFAFMAPTILMAADALMTIVAPITLIVELIQWIGKGFENAFSYIGKMIPALGVVGRIMKGIASLAIVYAAYKAFAALASGGPLGVIGGIVVAATIMSVGMGAINGLSTPVNDAIINPDGDIITTHPDDYLIATKDPQDLANSVGGSGGSSSKVESLLEQLVKKDSNVYFDSQKVGSAEAVSSSKL